MKWIKKSGIYQVNSIENWEYETQTQVDLEST